MLVIVLSLLIYAISCSTINLENETEGIKILIQGLRYLSTQLKDTDTTRNIYPLCKNKEQCNSGVCDTSTGKCICDIYHDTHWSNPQIIKLGNITTYDYTNYTMCNYELKSQLTSFMLSMFIGFGAEHFYMERLDTAISKLIFYMFCYGLNIVYFIIWKFFPNKKHLIEFIGVYEAIYLSCGVIFIFLWNVYDWVNIGYNVLLDGNNMTLLPWNITKPN